MSQRLIITLKDENYDLINKIAKKKEISMAKILNILSEIFLDEDNIDFYKHAILTQGHSANVNTKLYSDNKEVENIEKISFEHNAGGSPKLSVTKLCL